MVTKYQKLLLSSASLLPILGAAQADRPNIIILNIDDMGYSDPSCFGGDYVNTTNIDQLANEGLSLTQFYTSCPISSPSRVGLTTGMYPTRWGINTFLQERANNAKNEQNDFLSDKAPSMARALKQSGYATGHFGKWHMGGGRDVKNAPSIRNYGFDEYVSTWESPDPDPRITSTNWIWAASDEIKRWDRTAYFIDKTLDFLSRHKGEPCFVSLWPDDVHTPWVYDGDEASLRESAGSFSIVLAELDKQIGRFMQGLKDLGIDENTIVIFTGDNGPAPAFDGHRTNDFRGQKGTLYEGGIRMPFIIRWPQHIPAGVKNDESVVCMVDLFPSLCAIAGAEVPTEYPLDGLDMSDVIMGQSSRERTTPLFWEFGKCKADRVSPHIAVREGEWKLLVNADGTRVELYNMTTDFNEKHNVANANPVLTERLKKAAIDWFNEAYREYADNIVYVVPDGNEDADGTSWAHATTLTHAIALAQSVSGAQIWMKQGTYQVYASLNCDNIAFYGGFNGTEKKLAERDWNSNPTIIDGRGTVSPLRNSLTTTVSTVLDGLIVQNGFNQADANGNGNGGGAILNDGAVVRNCIFRNNRTQNGKNGAAIHCHTGQLRIENCLFVNNTSSGNGGAVQVGGGVTATIVNCTLCDNIATGPGGAFGLGANTSNLNVYNTIAWRNTGQNKFSSYGQNTDVNGGGAVVSKYSAIESQSTKFTDGDDISHLVLSQENTPMFEGDGYTLAENSPCIDAGNASLTSRLDYDLSMQRRLSGAQIDMGAYEFDNGEPIVGNSIIHVSPDGDASADGSSWQQATSLSHALSLADAYIDKAILWLKEGTYFVTTPIHPDKLELYGGFVGSEQNLEERDYAVHQTIIDGGGTVSPFRNSNLDGTVMTVLDGLIVQNGLNQAGANGNGNGGGAILTNGATVRNCIFRSNRTQNGKNGAAIHCHLGQVSIQNSLFTGNTSSGNGGAIQVGGGTTATIINCTFCDNTASGPGGAFGLGTNASNLNVYNTIAWRNTGTGTFSSYGQNTDVNGGGTVIALSSAIESQSTKFTDGNDEEHIFLSQENTPMFAEDSYQLQKGSPCIDTGDDNYAAINSHDLAAGPRVIGIHIDRGAYEYKEDGANAIRQTNDGQNAIYNIYNVTGVRVGGGIKTEDNRQRTTDDRQLKSGIYIIKEGSASANGKKIIRR